MDARASTISTDTVSQDKSRYNALAVDVWLAGMPLLAALIAMIYFTGSITVLRILVIVLFVTSSILVFLWIQRNLTAGRLAGIALVAGFWGWYAFPGLVSLLKSVSQFGSDLPLPIDKDTVVWSVIYLSLFLLCWRIAYYVFMRKRPSASAASQYTGNLKRIIPLAFAAALVGFIPYIASGLTLSEVVDLIFQSRAVDKPWLFTSNLGNTSSALVYVAQSAMVAGACLLWAVTRDKRLKRMLRMFAGSLALLISIIIYFDQGTRSITALVILPVLLLVSIEIWRRSQKRMFVWITIVAVVAIFVLQFQLFFRSSYTRASTSDLLLTDWTTFGGTSDYFTETLFAVQIVPAYHDFFHESVIEEFAVSPIPRFIWPEKPATQVVWFYSLLRWGVDIYQTGGNTFPGIVGQYYMSWGWLGPIIIGLMLAWVTARTDAFLERQDFQRNLYSVVVAMMLAVWLFISFRVLSPGFFYPVLFAAGIVFLSSTKSSNSMQLDKA